MAFNVIIIFLLLFFFSLFFFSIYFFWRRLFLRKLVIIVFDFIIINWHVTAPFMLNCVLGFFSFMFGFWLFRDMPLTAPSIAEMEIPGAVGLDHDAFVKWVLDGNLPFYPDFNKEPSYKLPRRIDLFGLIEIWELGGPARLERILFYKQLDYAAGVLAARFVMQAGDFHIFEDRIMDFVYRTLIEYRHQEWQSYDVRVINDRLGVLNQDMAALLIDFSAICREYKRILLNKDYNIMSLLYSGYGQMAGLKPYDCSWGRYSTLGFMEARKMTWDEYREPFIHEELTYEYSMMDLQLIIGYLRIRILENEEIYRDLFRIKLALEERDLKVAGIKHLTYKDIVHYRTMVDVDFFFYYARRFNITHRWLWNKQRLEVNSVIQEYDWILDDNKTFMDTYRSTVDADIQAKKDLLRRRRYRQE